MPFADLRCAQIPSSRLRATRMRRDRDWRWRGQARRDLRGGARRRARPCDSRRRGVLWLCARLRVLRTIRGRRRRRARRRAVPGSRRTRREGARVRRRWPSRQRHRWVVQWHSRCLPRKLGPRHRRNGFRTAGLWPAFLNFLPARKTKAPAGRRRYVNRRRYQQRPRRRNRTRAAPDFVWDFSAARRCREFRRRWREASARRVARA